MSSDFIIHHQMYLFRHASVFSTYLGQSVRPLVRHTFRFPFCQRLWALTKRQHCGGRHGSWHGGRHGAAHGGRHGGGHGGRQKKLADMVADIEVDKVAGLRDYWFYVIFPSRQWKEKTSHSHFRKIVKQLSEGLCAEYKVISDIPQENIVNTKSSFTFLFVQYQIYCSDHFGNSNCLKRFSAMMMIKIFCSVSGSCVFVFVFFCICIFLFVFLYL